jgi:hypothetical protein
MKKKKKQQQQQQQQQHMHCIPHCSIFVSAVAPTICTRANDNVQSMQRPKQSQPQFPIHPLPLPLLAGLSRIERCFEALTGQPKCLIPHPPKPTPFHRRSQANGDRPLSSEWANVMPLCCDATSTATTFTTLGLLRELYYLGEDPKFFLVFLIFLFWIFLVLHCPRCFLCCKRTKEKKKNHRRVS